MNRPSFLLDDGDDNSNPGDNVAAGNSSPLPRDTPTTPASPVLQMSDLTPNSQKIAKVITGTLATVLKQESIGVKRRLDLVLEKEDQTNRGVDDIKAGVRDVKRTTQTIDANQQKSMKVNPKSALDSYQQKLVRRAVWRNVMVAEPKSSMKDKVYREVQDQDDTITAAKEDLVKKLASMEASNTKSHLRNLVVEDLKKSDMKDFSSCAQWIKNHLSLEFLTETDYEFLRIMAISMIKFHNGKDIELRGRDLTNKELIGDSVDFWWSYVGEKMKKFNQEEGESCAPLLQNLMAQHGFEGKDKKRRSN